MKASFADIATALREAQNIVVLSHMRPDGDAIGSQLAMAISLRDLGKKVTVWNENGLPDSMRFLPESELVTFPSPEARNFDLVLALDTATKQRLGTPLRSIGYADQWINMDHHASNPEY
jgi:bifunctional oligoribonuclease and PAP phosphatase NrnA